MIPDARLDLVLLVKKYCGGIIGQLKKLKYGLKKSCCMYVNVTAVENSPMIM